ncbi:3-hydroxyacyl-CoA dehydrogenase [Frankia sp. CNm7]|uniref:L-carnitine dehydrogenase n=1 Tax=Frankia nepalensis TaxID=1836974 RepID=A0A937UMM9_9ACTN|nr:3-hydroxyacyl-CoA dehydrogenase NAD-binding domain-containing protein [Frankia nepalensis]MBL7500853.1 3-hydroxyacyl-CoA dehydrogenase [Frankia nepalensis]MBL7509219.1 3-hydroxyacyl-CoA dehydrogenase [Frankia nepalensis]MBL7517321.1 3-hydroxyacyl-CoA dehydrogenase [Frankia nepalensis]MBL7627017.1 L-carnitine dehydrogenase [Frankia nepalensis]
MTAAPPPVAVVGTGVIGAGWTALFLARGHDVVAYDPAPGAEPALRGAVGEAWPALTRLGLARGASIDRLTFTASAGEAAAVAMFVQENGPERRDLKQRLLAELDEAAVPETPIASSSSGLMPSQLQAMCGRHPERVLVGHPFHPAHLIPLVEVVPGERTDDRVVRAAMALYTAIGKRPILVRQELPGHVTNRLQAALWREAYSLVERGVATVADIDTAISHGPGLRWALLGPLLNQHLSGGAGGLAHVLEHLGPPTQEWMDDLGQPRLTPALADLLIRGVDDALAGVDQRRLVTERDALLVDLLQRKAQGTVLP